VPIAAFLFLLMIWFIATIAKVNLCLQLGVQQCK
jgi:hypothetical protein